MEAAAAAAAVVVAAKLDANNPPSRWLLIGDCKPEADAAEGSETGPTLCFRGIDNKTYYKLDPSDLGKYINDTGCGNTLDLSKPVVRQMVLDSLRHWVTEYGIDGFRFDLAPVLGREPFAFNKDAAFFKELEADPVLSKVKLIAEPWDPGPGGYQLGQFGKKWS